MKTIQLNTAITGHRENWCFIGSPEWRQDVEDIIYPPVWSYPNFDPDPEKMPNSYAHELAREDFAFLAAELFGDTDVSVDIKTPYGAVVDGGIVFRAADSSQFYVVDVWDMGRKGHYYEVSLSLQEETGYRRELARGKAPHSIVPEDIVQTGPKNRHEWNHSSADWVTVRVQASGTYIRVSVDGTTVFETRDRTYPVGRVGLMARGAVYFRNFRAGGIVVEGSTPWKKHDGELPRFFYPGGSQPLGFNAYPVVCRNDAGKTSVVWSHAPHRGDRTAEKRLVITSSADEGRTWGPVRTIFMKEGSDTVPTGLFAHRDGSLSCYLILLGDSDGSRGNIVITSKDDGETWSDPQEFLAGGKPLGKHEGLYSTPMRLSDGTVLICGYEYKTAGGGSEGSNAERLDRSLLFRSSDDGHSYQKPIYFDPDNFDHNECMVAEVGEGKLVAFMRTLSAPAMWTTTSEDGGNTWRPLVQSDVSAECPFLFTHSTGTLIMGNRGYGTYIRLSTDKGKTWGTTIRMSPASAMMGMVEMADGRVLNVMHEGYRVPGYIRAQFFTVTPEGPKAAL